MLNSVAISKLDRVVRHWQAMISVMAFELDGLSRRRIANIALAYVDAEGLDALTTRRIAKEMGVTSPALYHHFGNKSDLLDEVIRLALRDVRDPDRTLPWPQQITEMAVTYRSALIERPWLAAAMVTHRYRRFASHIVGETAAAMAAAKVPVTLIPLIIDSVEDFVYGAAIASATEFEPMPAVIPGLADHPEVAALLGKPRDSDATFQGGLEAILAGWQAKIAAHG
jgi:AcrR family transcriptional regulator